MPAITLRDAQTGSTAEILPEMGFNCYAFRAAVEKELVNVLEAEPGFAMGEKRASGSGIPIRSRFRTRSRRTVPMERAEL